jgi:hypothetical protein
MFDWQSWPDPVFAKIVTEALEHALDYLDLLEPAELGDAYPQVARVFTREAAEREVRRLLEAHRSERVFHLGAYHLLLLHDILFDFTEVYNDGALGEIVEEGTAIRRIDFDGILTLFFRDVDFTIPLEELEGVGVEGRERLGVEDQAFNVAAGLEPHPEELVLEEVSPRGWDGPGEEPSYRPGSAVYPSWAEEPPAGFPWSL